jgi:hypothetical protein
VSASLLVQLSAGFWKSGADQKPIVDLLRQWETICITHSIGRQISVHGKSEDGSEILHSDRKFKNRHRALVWGRRALQH